VRITAALANELVDLARAAAPSEACALLAGPAAEPALVYPITNVAGSGSRFCMEPQAMIAAMMDIDGRAWQLLAICHTHVSSVAYPSATDIDQAYYPGVPCLIVSLQSPGAPCVRAFDIVEGRALEIDVTIV
jgi:proteasome lid subunit RPN8/RPN11